MKQISDKMNCSTARLTQANLLQLQQYDGPGNVRELHNIIERAAIISQCSALRTDLPFESTNGIPKINVGLIGETESGLQIVSDSEMKRREKKNLAFRNRHNQLL